MTIENPKVCAGTSPVESEGGACAGRQMVVTQIREEPPAPVPISKCSSTPPVPPAQVSRPGISPEMLTRAGIRRVDGAEAYALIGMVAPGMVVPYRDPDGSPLIVNDAPYYRLRVEHPTPGGPKYLARANSGSHQFIPPGLLDLLQRGGTLTIAEGEFKAMSMVEAGIAAVAVSGITCTCPNDADGQPGLLPALATLIAEHGITRVAFVGDNDTALIPAFSHEMAKLKQCLGPVELILPRIPLDAPGKGPDDLRHALGNGFPAEWERIRAGAEPVEAGTTAAELATRLLDRELDAAARLMGRNCEQARAKLGRLGAAYDGDPLALASITRFARALGVDKPTLKAEVKNEQQRKYQEDQEALVEALVGAEAAKPVLLFDNTGKNYWRQEDDRTWGALVREDARLEFHVQGLSKTGIGGGVAPVDEALNRAQKTQRVDYAGPICGRPPGLLRLNGKKVLVTQGPKHITTAPGLYPTIQIVLNGLFGVTVENSHHATQIKLFMAWLKLGRKAVMNPDQYLPGQVLALVGPPGCGKSLLQSRIITPALGGRVADPGLWFTGKSNFNSDLWAAEHLALGDQSLGENGAQKAHLQEQLKQVVAATEYSLHPKNKEAMTLNPVWRVSLSANDDSESASSLPVLDRSFADKIIYLLCYQNPEPFFDEQANGRQEFEARIAAELPAFLHAVDQFEIPATLSKARFGVTEWHHPEIVEVIDSTNPLNPLSDLLLSWMESWMAGSEYMKKDPATEKTLTTSELIRELEVHQQHPGLTGITTGSRNLRYQLAALTTRPVWQGILSRRTRRTGSRIQNQKQIVWHFQAPVATPQPAAVGPDLLRWLRPE